MRLIMPMATMMRKVWFFSTDLASNQVICRKAVAEKPERAGPGKARTPSRVGVLGSSSSFSTGFAAPPARRLNEKRE